MTFTHKIALPMHRNHVARVMQARLMSRTCPKGPLLLHELAMSHGGPALFI